MTGIQAINNSTTNNRDNTVKWRKSVEALENKEESCVDCKAAVAEGDKVLRYDTCDNCYRIAVSCQIIPTPVPQYFADNSEAVSAQLHWYYKACNIGTSNIHDKQDKGHASEPDQKG